MNTLLLIFINFSILVVAYLISMVSLNEYAKKYNMSLKFLSNMDYDLSLFAYLNNLQVALDGINKAVMGCASITVLVLILMRIGCGLSTNDALFITVIPNLAVVGISNTVFVIDGKHNIYKIHKKLHKQPIKF